MTLLSDFEITAVHKLPANTLGVYDMFYYGHLDGVEVGAPCDSEREAKNEAIRTLNGGKPYKLEDLLQEQVEWLSERIAEGKRPDAIVEWSKEREVKSRLIVKIKDYKAVQAGI